MGFTPQTIFDETTEVIFLSLLSFFQAINYRSWAVGATASLWTKFNQALKWSGLLFQYNCSLTRYLSIHLSTYNVHDPFQIETQTAARRPRGFLQSCVCTKLCSHVESTFTSNVKNGDYGQQVITPFAPTPPLKTIHLLTKLCISSRTNLFYQRSKAVSEQFC